MIRDPNHVFVAIPSSHETQLTRTMMSLVEMVAALSGQYRFTILPGGGPDISHIRNRLLHYWRTKTDAARMVSIDADVVFTVNDIAKLLSWDVPYVAGLYPLKGFTCRWSWAGWAHESMRTPGLWDVREVATGFTCLRYDLVEELVEGFPETEYRCDDPDVVGEVAHELYSVGSLHGRRMSEDFLFSQRVHRLGHEVNVEPTILVGHRGMVDMVEMHRHFGTLRPPELRG